MIGKPVNLIANIFSYHIRLKNGVSADIDTI